MSRMWRVAAIVCGVVVLQLGVFGVADATHGGGGGQHPGHGQGQHPGHGQRCASSGSSPQMNPHCTPKDQRPERPEKQGEPQDDERNGGPDETDGPKVWRGLRDRDGDAIFDAIDNCPDARNRDQADSGGDGRGDACTSDDDGDAIDDSADNCPQTWNGDQHDGDRDGEGDACDPDRDDDEVPNELEPVQQVVHRAVHALHRAKDEVTETLGR